MPESEWIQVTFERGLNTFDRPSLLSDGECQVLENLEWIPGGGLTPRPAWKAAGSSPTGEPTSKRSRGVYGEWYESGVRKLVVSTFDNSANFVTYKTNVSDPTAFTSYTSVDTAAVSASYQGLPMAFATGNDVLVMSQPGFTSGQMRAYNGTSTSAIATNDIAGRLLVYHLNRFWTGGAVSNPTFIRYCEIGDHTQWNTDENFIPVSRADGEPTEDAVVWDRGLLIGKRHSLWFLSGYTVDTFALNPITRKIGCAPGRSLVATENGVFIIGIDGNVYLYDGASVKTLTRTTGVTIPTSGYVSGSYVGGKLYATTSVTPTVSYCFDGGWRKETYADTSNAPQDLLTYDDSYLIGGSTNGSRLLSVRKEVGAFAASTYREPTKDAGVGETFQVTTREWWPKGPFGKSTLRSVYLKYHQWYGGTSEKITITPVVDGTEVTAQAKVLGGKTNAGTYSERADFNAAEGASFSGKNVALKVSCAPTAGEAQTYSIDEMWVQMLSDKGRR